MQVDGNEGDDAVINKIPPNPMKEDVGSIRNPEVKFLINLAFFQSFKILEKAGLQNLKETYIKFSSCNK